MRLPNNKSNTERSTIPRGGGELVWKEQIKDRCREKEQKGLGNKTSLTKFLW
jgi:hypothetical protein